MLTALVVAKAAEYAWKAKKLADPNGPHADMVNSAKTQLTKCRNGVAQCLDGAGRFVDEQTGGKYSDKISSSVDKAKQLVGKPSEDGGGQSTSGDGSGKPEDSAADPGEPRRESAQEAGQGTDGSPAGEKPAQP